MSGAPSVWNRLKTAFAKEKIAVDGKLVFGDTSIRVIPDADGNEAKDLRTGADNLRAADFMLAPIQAKHSQKPIVSGSMRHAFLFDDESKKGCSQSLFYVRRTSQNGWSRDALRNWLSTDFYKRDGNKFSPRGIFGCVIHGPSMSETAPFFCGCQVSGKIF
jgi:hypothetical protein